MKKISLALITSLLLVAPLSQAEMHEFTSASDPSKKLWAEVTGYDSAAGQVTLQLQDRRKIVSPVSAFSEDDKAYIETAGLALAAGRNLALRFEDDQEVVGEKKNPANGFRTLNTKDGFKLNLRNNSQEVFKGLKADYQIFYAAYADPFEDREKTDRVEAGKLDIPELAPREDTDVETESVALTSITRLPLKECVGGT